MSYQTQHLQHLLLYFFYAPLMQFLLYILIRESCGLLSILPQSSLLCNMWLSTHLCQTCVVLELGRGYDAALESPNGFLCSSEHVYTAQSSVASPSPRETTHMRTCPKASDMWSQPRCLQPCDHASGRLVNIVFKLCALDPPSVGTILVFVPV